MKVSINVECTPEEARSFFGLPEVKPLQDAVMAQMQSNMQKMAGDPETMFKLLFPLQTESFGEMQKAFWNQFGGQFGGKSDS